MRHFAYYPKIEYGNNLAVNIMVRGKIRDAVLSNTGLYYKYTMEEGERFDIISNKYYGNSDYVWAIFYANNIIDPVEESPKAHNDFIAYIKAKYGSIQTPNQTVHHYEYTEQSSGKTFIIDEATYYQYLSELEPDTSSLQTVVIDGKIFYQHPESAPSSGSFKKVSIVTQFEYESRLNEERRNIVVLDKKYLTSIINELEELFA